MITVYNIIKVLRVALSAVVLGTFLVMLHLSVADTIVNIDFDDQGVLQTEITQPVAGVPSIKLSDTPLPVIASAQPASPSLPALVTIGIGDDGCCASGPGYPDITLTALLVFSVLYLTLLRAGALRTLRWLLLLILSTSLAAGPTIADVQSGLYLKIGGGASPLTPDILSSIDNDRPYYLSADQHQPFRVKMQSIEQLMAFKPAPKKQFMISESTLKRMEARSKKGDGAEDGQTMLRQATVVMDKESLLRNSRAGQAPVMGAALPIGSVHQISEEIRKPVLFEFDSSTIRDMYHEQLRPLVEHLRTTPDARVTLTGHTDSVGSDQYNELLSIRRAGAVRRFLLQQGIDRKMIRILGAGEKRPVKSNMKPSGRKANRRVSIVVD